MFKAVVNQACRARIGPPTADRAWQCGHLPCGISGRLPVPLTLGDLSAPKSRRCPQVLWSFSELVPWSLMRTPASWSKASTGRGGVR